MKYNPMYSKMINPPKTLERAERYRYNYWGEDLNGDPYNPERCAYEVLRGGVFYQCSCSNGHGFDKLYCELHGEMVK